MRMTEESPVKGYRIWRDPSACTPFTYRWALVDYPDDGTAGQNHGGASSYQAAVEAANLHKQAMELEKAKAEK